MGEILPDTSALLERVIRDVQAAPAPRLDRPLTVRLLR